jgi:CHAT domain-containing protein
MLTQPVNPDAMNYYRLPYLVHKFGFSNSFSATVHFTQTDKKRRARKNLLAFAPSYSNISLENTRKDFEALRQNDLDQLILIPGIKEEVRRISGFMKADVYQDFNATETNFRANASDYKVLHLAMHTILDDQDPLYSKLAFAQMIDSVDDGFLHTFEIYNMQLNAELAVLSSCNSGYGALQEGEGIQSLARGFAYAGCPSILMTLWEVSDYSTIELMEKFYLYLDMGHSKSEALHLSKIDFLANADHLKSNPFFWSSFVLVGDTRPIYTSKTVITLMNIGILLLPLPLLFIFYRRYRRSSARRK